VTQAGGLIVSDDADALKTQAAARFNTMAAEFDEQGAFAHFGRRLVEVVGVEPGQHVLDVATGRGAVFFPAAERVGATGEVVGVDLAENMVRAVNEEAERRGLGAPARVMDAEQLDFPDAAFDRVLCGFGLMFFPHQNQALSEFRRVLKPGGRVGVSTWRASQAEDLQTVLQDLGLFDTQSSRPPGWIAEPDVLARALATAGFIDVRVVEDPLIARYDDLEHYWRTVRVTGAGRRAAALAPDQVERARAALADRLRTYQQPDGIHVEMTALLAVASRQDDDRA
jgi:SAM-dependent methyltransferase